MFTREHVQEFIAFLDGYPTEVDLLDEFPQEMRDYKDRLTRYDREQYLELPMSPEDFLDAAFIWAEACRVLQTGENLWIDVNEEWLERFASPSNH